MRALWPRSLAGQLALLVAIALFVAQAINFGLLLRERRQLRFEQIITPTVTRLVDAEDRLNGGAAPDSGHGHVRLVAANPIAADRLRRPSIEQAIAQSLAQAGFPTDTVVASVRPVSSGDRPRDGLNHRRASRLARFGKSYVGDPERIVGELREDAAVADADTVLVTVPNQLGVDYNAHLLETIVTQIAPALGWRD